MTTPTGIVKNEPVLVAHFVAWLLLQAGLIVVGRFHLITDSTWTALSSALAPVISAVLIGALGWLIRRVVSPAWKHIEQAAPEIAEPIESAVRDLLDKALANAQATFPMPDPPATTEGA